MRYPRPSALAVRLTFDHAKAEKAAAGLGLVTVGDLLEHLPRDRREARVGGPARRRGDGHGRRGGALDRLAAGAPARDAAARRGHGGRRHRRR